MKVLKRHITPRLFEALTVSPVIFLNGARQTGKSTLVQQIANEFEAEGRKVSYVTFDKPTQMAAAASSPETFLQSYPGQLIIDEVQLVPEIFRALKVVVDEQRMQNESVKNGKYLLTGSANIMALPNLADPLVGRMSVLTLYPLSTSEAIQSKGDGLERLLNFNFSGLDDVGLGIRDAMKMGSFPELLKLSERQSKIWFDGYINTMLQRDVRAIADLDKIALLPGLLRVLATRAGNLLNDADISRGLGLNAVTGKSYRNILKMMFVNFDVKPWYRNIGKRMVKSSKGYIADCLLMTYLLDLNLNDIAKTKLTLFGQLLENYVALELTKQLSFSEKDINLYHFRTSDGKEVDFVLETAEGKIYAIEVKSKDTVKPDDFKTIKLLAELTGTDFLGGFVLYGGREAVPFGKNLWAVPYHVLWQ